MGDGEVMAGHRRLGGLGRNVFAPEGLSGIGTGGSSRESRTERLCVLVTLQISEAGRMGMYVACQG